MGMSCPRYDELLQETIASPTVQNEEIQNKVSEWYILNEMLFGLKNSWKLLNFIDFITFLFNCHLAS